MDAAELVIRITGDVADIERKLNQTTSSVSSFGDRMEKAGRQISSTGQTLTKGVTAPLAALGGFAIKSAIDFESAFAGVRKTVDATEEEFAALSAGIRKMSREIPAAATEIARVGEAAGQLGIEKEHILSFTRVMVDLGVATNMASDDAAMALARLANITQMPQTEFDRLGSTVVHLGNNLATTESEIVEFGLRIAGAGKTVGLTEHQILAFGGALSSVGINAEAGGTAISRAFIKIARGVEDGGAMLDQFADVAGMSAAQFAKAWKDDAAGAMVAFIEGLGAVQEAGGDLFGLFADLDMQEIRLRDALLRSAGAGDLLRRSLELGAEAWEENNALTKEAEQRYQTAASQIAIFRNKVTDAAVTLGGALVPSLLGALSAMEPVGRWVMRGIEWFSNLSPKVQAVVFGVAALAAAAGPFLVVLGAIVSAVGTLAPLFAFLFNPITLMVAGIGLLVAALVLAYKHFGWFRTAVDGAWQALQVAWDFVMRWGSGLVTFLGGALRTVIGLFHFFAGMLTGDWGRMWDGLKMILSGAWQMIQGLARLMWGGLLDIAKAGIGWVVGKVGELPGLIMAVLAALPGQMFGLGADIMMGLLNGLKSMAGAVVGWAADMGKKLLGSIGRVIGWGSPAKEFIAMGEDSIEGLMIGLERHERALMGLLSKLGHASLRSASISFSPVPAPSASEGWRPPGAPPPGPRTLVLQVDGKEFARMVLPDIEDGVHRVEIVNAR